MSEFKKIDRRTFDREGNPSQNEKEDKISSGVELTDIVSQELDKINTFRFRETPYFADQLVARAVNFVSAGIIQNKVASYDFYNELNSALFNYFSGYAVKSSASSVLTGDYMVEYIFRQALGLNPGVLRQIMPVDRPLSSNAIGTLTEHITKNYLDFSNKIYGLKLREFSEDPIAKKVMRQQALKWNRQFKLGAKKSDYSSSEGLMQVYYGGVARHFQYLEKQGKLPQFKLQI